MESENTPQTDVRGPTPDQTAVQAHGGGRMLILPRSQRTFWVSKPRVRGRILVDSLKG